MRMTSKMKITFKKNQDNLIMKPTKKNENEQKKNKDKLSNKDDLKN